MKGSETRTEEVNLNHLTMFSLISMYADLHFSFTIYKKTLKDEAYSSHLKYQRTIMTNGCRSDTKRDTETLSYCCLLCLKSTTTLVRIRQALPLSRPPPGFPVIPQWSLQADPTSRLKSRRLFDVQAEPQSEASCLRPSWSLESAPTQR